MGIGYIRVSAQKQNTIRQEAMLESLGVDEIYIDKSSGPTCGNQDRLPLQKP